MNKNNTESIRRTGEVSSGDMRLNDIYFVIPPESITVITNEYDSSTFMLREAIPSTVKTGKKRINIHVPIAIDLEDPRMGYEQISKLLIQIRKSPIVTVENEKIRKEVIGSGTPIDTSIALLVENITGSIDREFPSLLRLDLQMTWFNHIPYTPNLVYQGNTEIGEPPRSKAPSSLFEEFYRHNTEENGLLINNPSGSKVLANQERRFNDLELFYKEYRHFPDSIETATVDSKEKSKLEKRKKTRKVDESKRLGESGWVSASDHWGYDEPDSLYYRWRRIEIPTTALGESGGLILEDLSFSLTTNISYIPLQGYSVPTAQFMGGSIAKMRAIVFAAPEYTEDNRPVETSDKLGQLQKVLDKISENRLQHPRYAKDDYLMIRHPLSKLMKYKGFQEKRLTSDAFYYEPLNLGRKKITFNYNDMLPVVLSNRTSATVEGIPFASRFQFDLKETRLREDNDLVRMVGEGAQLSRVTIRESWLKTLQILETEYGIKKETNSLGETNYVIKSNNKNPDRSIAIEVAEAMTNSYLANPDFTDIKSMIDSEYFKLDSGSLGSRAKMNALKAKGTGGTVAARLYRNPHFLNSEGVSFLVTELLKKTTEENYEGWAKKYQDASEPIRSFNMVPSSPSYPDIEMPLQRGTPTYYFHDFNETDRYKLASMKGMAGMAGQVDQHIVDNFQSKEAGNKVGEVLSAGGGVSPATNIAAMRGQEKKHGLVHNVADQKHRALMAARAMEFSTGMIDSMKYAFPAFKIYLKESNVLFDRELSVADLSADDRRNMAHGFRDFSEHFDVSNIIDIRIVRDETNPADLMILRVVSTQKDKVNRLKQEMEFQTADEELTFKKVMDMIVPNSSEEKDKPSKMEKRLKEAGLTEGTRIQARLGYDPNPNNLDIEFNGKIVSIRGQDVIEVICLGNGEELVKEIKGVNGGDEYSFNSNTPNMIARVLEKSPEVVSFGNLNYKSDSGIEIPIFPAFLGGRTVLDNIFAPSLFDDYTEVGTQSLNGASLGLSASLTAIGLSGAAASLGLIAAPVAFFSAAALPILAVGVSAGAVLWAVAELYTGAKRWLFGSPFTIYNNTLWEILNELTLRHPGTIVATVPYDNRSTIFFGEPNEHYFYRGPTPLEAGIITPDNFFNTTAKQTYDDFLDTDTTTSIERGSKRKKIRKELKKNNKVSEQQVILNMQKPFRTYHMVTSEHDIIMNSIEVTSKDIANSIQIAFPEDSSDSNFDGSEGFSGYELTDEIQADDDIYKEYINKKVLTFHNAHRNAVKDMPERYAKSVLCRELEKVYRGKIAILGRSKVKPHDVLILRDTYNGITGPVGVSKVVHIVSPQGGWITEITPKMMVFPDNATGQFQLSLVLKGANFWLSDEAEKFYTNVRRFMPLDHGSFNNNQDLISTFKYIKGSEFVDLESKIGIENLNTGNIEEEESAFLNTLRKGTVGDRLVVEGGINSAAVIGELTGSKLLSPALVQATRTGLSNTAGSAANLVSSKTVGSAGGALFKTGLSAGGVLLKGSAAGVTAVGGIAVHLLLNSLINGFVNWSKYRQPILFYPLTRNGEPWYAGMNGFKDNTIIGHFDHQLQRGINRMQFYWAYAMRQRDEFSKHL